MKTLEELKTKWSAVESNIANDIKTPPLDRIVRRRVNVHLKHSMRYFWASFFLQLLVYALLSHVIIRYWGDLDIVSFAITGMVIYIPFTVVILRRFKRIAVAKTDAQTTESLYAYTKFTRDQLVGFFRFKKTYEMILIPLSTAIGVIVVFNLYVPGGIAEHLQGALVVFLISLLACVAAILKENKISFIEPLKQLEIILKEFD